MCVCGDSVCMSVCGGGLVCQCVGGCGGVVVVCVYVSVEVLMVVSVSVSVCVW